MARRLDQRIGAKAGQALDAIVADAPCADGPGVCVQHLNGSLLEGRTGRTVLGQIVQLQRQAGGRVANGIVDGTLRRPAIEGNRPADRPDIDRRPVIGAIIAGTLTAGTIAVRIDAPPFRRPFPMTSPDRASARAATPMSLDRKGPGQNGLKAKICIEPRGFVLRETSRARLRLRH